MAEMKRIGEDELLEATRGHFLDTENMDKHMKELNIDPAELGEMVMDITKQRTKKGRARTASKGDKARDVYARALLDGFLIGVKAALIARGEFIRCGHCGDFIEKPEGSDAKVAELLGTAREALKEKTGMDIPLSGLQALPICMKCSPGVLSGALAQMQDDDGIIGRLVDKHTI